MALTVDKLKEDNTIKGANLSDSVLAAIATLANNVAKIDIDSAVGINYGMIDNIVAEIAGVPIIPGHKTTEFVRTHMKALREKADAAGNIGTITTERDALKEEVKTLKKQMAEGSTDVGLKKQITELEAKIAQKDADLANITKTKDAEIVTLKKSLGSELETNVSLALRNAADAYFATLTFNKAIPQVAIDAIKRDAIAKVQAEKGKAAFDGEGADRKLVFLDSQGTILKNAANGLAPYGFGDLAGEYMKDALVVEKGGGGTKPPTGGGGGKVTPPTGGGLDISSARTQGDVINLIRAQLKGEGLAVTNPGYQARYDELYGTEGVAELPIK